MKSRKVTIRSGKDETTRCREPRGLIVLLLKAVRAREAGKGDEVVYTADTRRRSRYVDLPSPMVSQQPCEGLSRLQRVR